DYVVELQSTNTNTTIKIAVERNTDPSLHNRVFQRIYFFLRALKLSFRAYRREMLGLDGAFMKGPFPSQCLGDDIDLHPSSNFTFISDRQKGIIPAIKNVFPSAEHKFCLRHIHENMEYGWCGQAYKDLLWRSAFAISVKEFKNCRAKYDLFLSNIYEVFNGKIVRGRDKPVITLLEYIMEYCMKRIVNVKSVIDKSYWNMALNDRPTPPLEAWVNPCCWLTTWRETYSHKVGRPKKKRKRSKHEDEPFVKDGKLSKKGRTITCQSCGNIRHNKATCKGQGGNNAEASGGASVGVGSQVTETRNADRREMGDGMPTQSSVAGGAS
ncbi:chloroplast stem-loop binding protein of 41 kDa b, chloroplastic, partial [Tanacetum coccineum]